MAKVIAIANQKGGCSKTTVAANLGIGLVMAGKKVCLIDADPQGSLTASLGYCEESPVALRIGPKCSSESASVAAAGLGKLHSPEDISYTLATIMMNIINEEEFDPTEGILHHGEGVDLIPANIELSGLEVSLANVMSREMILKEYVEQIRDAYDYILIDCMPSLGVMTINALVAADTVLIPVLAAYLPVKGLQQLIKTISVVKKRLNKQLSMEGILITMADYRTNNAKDITGMLKASYEDTVGILENYIPFSVKLAEASAVGCSIYRYAPKSKAADSFQRLTREILGDDGCECRAAGE